MSESSNNLDDQQRFRELEQENKRLEKELLKMREKVQSTEKGKVNFLSNMSHSIRTPMNAIIGFSELISMDTISLSKKKEYTKIINDKGIQLLGLIDDIIEISKIDSGKFELNFSSFSLDDFLNDIYLSILHKKLKDGKENIEFVLEKHSQDEFHQIQTDSGRLQQILNNLLSYAIHATSKGKVHFGYSIKENKYIEFFVKDTSHGLNKDEQKVIFENYWQFDDFAYHKIAGNGLGLYISKVLIELLGGKIWIQSEIEVGTEICFTIPIDKSNKVNKLVSKRNEFVDTDVKSENVWKNKVILVVEDDAVNYQFIEALFEKSQVQLLHAENGEQALELCKTINKLDLILMDLKLPEKNGYEITREIKEIRKEIPIIAQTAYPLSEVQEKCLASGCEDVISKPIEIELFLNKLNFYLAEK
jgi:CheY-like chemotaxis protein/nitrogen-specific signal transduction histidine kinase